jgi:transposase-like protein
MATTHLSIPALMDRVPDEESAYRLLEEMRWGDRPVCPHCGSARPPYFLEAKNGGRKTTRGKVSPRRVWKCSEPECRKQFSVTTGTIFHGSHIPLRKWLMVTFEMVSSKNGVSSREVERKYDLTPKSAWFMLHRIREAMKRDPRADLLVGTIIADEAYIGGRTRPIRGSLRADGAENRERHVPKKTAVVSVLHRESGEVRSRVVPSVTAQTLSETIRGEVQPVGSSLYTDEHQGYRTIGTKFSRDHQTVMHSVGEYVRGDVTTNPVENFFGQLKRSIDGTFHHVSPEHLDRYLAEFDYRYSTRKLSDTRRMERLMGQTAGRRLKYREPRP